MELPFFFLIASLLRGGVGWGRGGGTLLDKTLKSMSANRAVMCLTLICATSPPLRPCADAMSF